MVKSSPKDIVNKVALYIKDKLLIEKGDSIVVAVSGGADSICLLNILLELKDKFKLDIKACHYNHKLRGDESDQDEIFVRNFCKDRGVELEVGCKPDEFIIKNEMDARECRYSFFEKVFLKQGRVGAKIALAHNLNDLSETFLMRLIRGSGLIGLSSILPQRDFYIRPLLQISRNEIIDYLREKGCDYRQDSSNLDQKYLRNKIRHKILPDLRKINPNIDLAVSGAAMQIAEDYGFIGKEVSALFERIVKKESEYLSISLGDWEKVDPVLKTHLLHYSYHQLLNPNDISRKQLEKIVQLIENKVGKKFLPLPHSLRFEFKNGRIYMYQTSNLVKENNGQSTQE
ncbi:MAG: tRNA(Ile)-lysidine synthase [bacterium ADurb.Bin212]|nr:MAG: tRNA(Ile)-lysidine synthase [bacterium ADurb.Bin212]